jgi:hypothetical protein
MLNSRKGGSGPLRNQVQCEISRRPAKRKDPQLRARSGNFGWVHNYLLLYNAFREVLEVLLLIVWFIVPISTADT